MKRFSFLLLFLLSVTTVFTQIISGPMLGQVELRDAKIWITTGLAGSFFTGFLNGGGGV